MKILYLFKEDDLRSKIKNPNLNNCDVIVIAVKYLSTRDDIALQYEVLDKVKNKYNKEIYLLIDRPLEEKDKIAADFYFPLLIRQNYHFLFSDFYYFVKAKEYDALDKMIYYSPTLLLNPYEIATLKQLGLNKFIISKDCEYNGYLNILENRKDCQIGMMCFGYPQLYMSKRKMLSLFLEEHQDIKLMGQKELTLKESSRDQYFKIHEDNYLFYIFSDKIFFPSQALKDFLERGMEYFFIDSSFIDENMPMVELVRKALNGESVQKENFSSYLLNQEIVYGQD